MHSYTVELLYHFNCGDCKNWWSYAFTPHHTEPIYTQSKRLMQDKDFYCPHCGGLRRAEGISGIENLYNLPE
jgi:hypothetical protein